MLIEEFFESLPEEQKDKFLIAKSLIEVEFMKNLNDEISDMVDKFKEIKDNEENSKYYDIFSERLKKLINPMEIIQFFMGKDISKDILQLKEIEGAFNCLRADGIIKLNIEIMKLLAEKITSNMKIISSDDPRGEIFFQNLTKNNSWEEEK